MGLRWVSFQPFNFKNPNILYKYPLRKTLRGLEFLELEIIRKFVWKSLLEILVGTSIGISFGVEHLGEILVKNIEVLNFFFEKLSRLFCLVLPQSGVEELIDSLASDVIPLFVFLFTVEVVAYSPSSPFRCYLRVNPQFPVIFPCFSCSISKVGLLLGILDAAAMSNVLR